jgi:hypothetical protein
MEEKERDFTIKIPVTQHDSAVFAGFQQMWAEGEVDGDAVEFTVGAGTGSGYGIVRFRGKSYVLRAQDIVEAVVEMAEDPNLVVGTA